MQRFSRSQQRFDIGASFSSVDFWVNVSHKGCFHHGFIIWPESIIPHTHTDRHTQTPPTQSVMYMTIKKKIFLMWIFTIFFFFFGVGRPLLSPKHIYSFMALTFGEKKKTQRKPVTQFHSCCYVGSICLPYGQRTANDPCLTKLH